MENTLNVTFDVINSINQKDSNDLLSFNNTIDDIVRISITGSSLFKENPKDIDYLVLVKNFKQEQRFTHMVINNKPYDFFIVDVEMYKEILTHMRPSPTNMFNVSFYINDTVYGDFEFNYNIKDYENKQKRAIVRYLESALFNPYRSTFKNIWWHYLTLKFLENQQYVITNEDKEKMTRWSNQQITEEDTIYWKNVLNKLKEEGEV